MNMLIQSYTRLFSDNCHGKNVHTIQVDFSSKTMLMLLHRLINKEDTSKK